MTINIDQKKQIWKEILDEVEEGSPIKRSNEMSINDFSKIAHVSKSRAKKLLDELEAKGKLKARRTSLGVYYSPI